MLRSDVSKLEQIKEDQTYLIKTYRLKTKMIKEALEIINQQITAIAKKVDRYEAPIMHYRQTMY